MLKRRPLNANKQQKTGNQQTGSEPRDHGGGFSQATGGLKSPERPPQQPRQPQNQNNRNRNQRGNRNPQNPSGQPGQPNQQNRQGQGHQQNRGPNQPHGRPQQQNRGPQGSGRGPSQRHPQPQRRPAPPPPAYIQRDLLLIPKGAGTEGIEQVRIKYDPLAKKVPAHVTLIFPEPAAVIAKEFLKELATADLPVIQSLTFSNITIEDEMYLWLVPDEESKNKLIAWRQIFVNKLSPGHTQTEDYSPHMTLGYIPRSQTPEEAIMFTKNLVALPLTLEFEKILLEEFSENQISTSVDSLPLAPETH